MVPAFNEEGTIAAVLSDLHVILAGEDIDFETIDDGSHDRTAEEIGHVPFPMTLLRHETGRG